MKTNSILKVYWKNNYAKFGTIVMFIFVIFAIIGPIFFSDLKADYANTLKGPSLNHWLGTDASGRDTLSQFILGTNEVLLIAFFTGLFTVIIGVIIGVISGLVGGVVDDILMLITTVVLTIPTFPVLMVLSLVVSASNPLTFGLLLSLWSWAGLAKTIRAQVLSLKHSEFIQASKILGLSKKHIIKNDIFPQIIPFILVNYILIMKNSVLASVGLMMLGLAPFKGEHWGMMLNLAMTKSGAMFGSGALVYLLTPIIGIVLFQVSCFMISKGLEDAFNPRKRGEIYG